jgi:hypothetical protein
MSGIFDQIINYSPPLIVSGTVNYKGTWDASANSPTLNASPAASTKGDYYVVSTAGTQFGITFAIGDWIISNGTAWEKVDLTDAVSSVFGRTGAVVGVSTDYSAVGITNTAIGASSPSTGAFTTVSASTPIAVASGGTGVSTSTGTTNVVLSNSPTIVTPVIAQINDASGNETLKLASIASAVNEISIENAATGNPVHIRATGGDASVGLHLVAKGASGYVNVTDGVDETKRIMFNAAGGTTNTRTMLSSTQTVDRTLTLPDATGTLLYGGGPLGTPSSGTVTNLTGTASININGTVGATTASTGAFTTLTSSFLAASGPLASFSVAQGLYGYYSAGGVIGAYSNNTGTLASLILNGSSIAIRPAGSTVGDFTTSGLAVTGALSSTTGATFATSSGDCGIGTSSPASSNGNVGKILQVASAGNTSSSIIASTAGVGLDNAGIFEVRATAQTSGSDRIGQIYIGRENTSTTALSGYMGFSTPSSGTFAERMRIDSSGNVGIGTTPSAWQNGGNLQLSGANVFGNIGITYGANAYYNAGWKYITTGYGASYQNLLNGQHQFFTSTGTGTAGNAITFTQAMTLDENGNLLVGTTSAISSGTSIVNLGSSRQVLTVKGDADASYTLGVWSATTSGDNLFSYFATEASITVRGAISYNRAGGLTVYGTTSDYRAKDILGPVVDSGVLIDSVPVYMGKMKGATQERPMFIAHETPAYAHTGEKDAVDAEGKPIYQQIDTSALIPVLWAEIQSLRQRVAALESN